MELYAKILNYTIPVFLLLILIEHFFEWKTGKRVNRSLDSVSSISSGVTNVIKDTLGLTISIFTYDWMVTNLGIFEIKSTWLTYLVTFIVVDFKGYWVHRWEHKINILWSRHVIHHSSEEFNLSCGLRQTVSTIFDYFAFLLLPAALLGVPVEVIAVVVPIHLFLQFWYHTRLIGRLGVLERVMVTPSHHRVHHAMNGEYLDKNFGQIFITWDKLFGTFQKELPKIPCVFGITRPARTWNPIKINFQHFFLMAKDAYHTQDWKDKFRIWWKPTGWRPDDVKVRFPVYSITDIRSYQKYDSPSTRGFKLWAWIQLMFNYFLLIYLFSFIVEIGAPLVFFNGFLVVLSIYAYTELMDRNPNALLWEMLKSLLILGFIYVYGDWFFANELVGSWFTTILGLYQVASVFLVVYFSASESKAYPQKPVNRKSYKPPLHYSEIKR